LQGKEAVLLQALRLGEIKWFTRNLWCK